MISKRQIKTFFVSLSVTFLMVLIPHLGIKNTWVTPQPKAYDILEKIQPRLEIRINNFKLTKQLIPIVSAGSPYDQASAYTVIDLDNGQVLASKNLSEKLPIASLTKVMTAIVALDLAEQNELFEVSARASAQIPTKVMLKPGEKYTLGDLLNHSLISSANDSTEVIREGIDAKFGQDVFIKAMNLKAQVIGLQNTHFTNAPGYDNKNHFSTAEDLSILSVYALRQYPTFADIVAKESEDLTKGGEDLRFYLNNWNGLLGIYPGVSGIKIGNTEQAGQCTIVVAERAGKKLLTVVLGAPGVLERDLWAAELLDLGFSKSKGLTPIKVTEEQLKQKYASWKYFE